MKILILGNQARSTSNFWTVLMRRMRAAGHEVLCAVPAGDDAAEAAIRAIGEEDPAFRKGPAVRLCHYPLDRKGLNPLRDMATMHALYRLFKQEKPDLLFASTIKPVIYGCMAARLARVPHIYATITGLGYAFEADNFFKKCVNRLSIGLYHCALAGAEGVFFQNRDDAELFRKVGILRRSARVLMARGTGVDIRRFAEAPLPPLPAEGCAPEEREIIFLLVGRLLEAKGLPEYAAAAKELKTQYPAARFQLLGPPEQGLGSVDLAQVRRWHLSSRAEARLRAALARWRGSSVRAEALSWDRVSAEVPFFQPQTDSPHGDYLEGAMDLLCADADCRRALVVDYKTGDAGLSMEEVRERHAMQAEFYAGVLLAEGFKRVECAFVCVERDDPETPGEPLVVRYAFGG